MVIHHVHVDVTVFFAGHNFCRSTKLYHRNNLQVQIQPPTIQMCNTNQYGFGFRGSNFRTRRTTVKKVKFPACIACVSRCAHACVCVCGGELNQVCPNLILRLVADASSEPCGAPGPSQWCSCSVAQTSWPARQ